MGRRAHWIGASPQHATAGCHWHCQPRLRLVECGAVVADARDYIASSNVLVVGNGDRGELTGDLWRDRMLPRRCGHPFAGVRDVRVFVAAGLACYVVLLPEAQRSSPSRLPTLRLKTWDLPISPTPFAKIERSLAAHWQSGPRRSPDRRSISERKCQNLRVNA
jgi:hypothetical protein